VYIYYRESIKYRFLPDGSLDTSFGTDGFFYDDMEASAHGYKILIQDERFSTEGVKDMNFGNNNGWSVNDIGPGFNFDGITGMVQLNNGDIIAAGTTLEDSSYDYAVAKFSSTLSSLDDLTNLGTEASVFPNLIQDEAITLKLTTESSLSLTISLINNLGQTITRWGNSVNIGVGTTERTLNLPANLTAGSYYIHLETKEGRTALPVRKM